MSDTQRSDIRLAGEYAEFTVIEVGAPYIEMALALPVWSSATAIGIVAGNILPASAVSALSVALYGMFLAIVIPPSWKNMGIITQKMAYILAKINKNIDKNF